jgi:hypothetical protein
MVKPKNDKRSNYANSISTEKANMPTVIEHLESGMCHSLTRTKENKPEF